MKRSTLYDGLALAKRPPRRDPKLRAWIVTQPCLVERLTGLACMWKVHAAHVPTGTRGMGMKGDDLFVPLCFHHHINEQHGRGTKWFEKTYGVDLLAEAQEYMREYERSAA